MGGGAEGMGDGLGVFDLLEFSQGGRVRVSIFFTYAARLAKESALCNTRRKRRLGVFKMTARYSILYLHCSHMSKGSLQSRFSYFGRVFHSGHNSDWLDPLNQLSHPPPQRGFFPQPPKTPSSSSSSQQLFEACDHLRPGEPFEGNHIG